VLFSYLVVYLHHLICFNLLFVILSLILFFLRLVFFLLFSPLLISQIQAVAAAKILEQET
jgi:hypothetical protein